jgi:hypothetical protein
MGIVLLTERERPEFAAQGHPGCRSHLARVGGVRTKPNRLFLSRTDFPLRIHNTVDAVHSRQFPSSASSRDESYCRKSSPVLTANCAVKVPGPRNVPSNLACRFDLETSRLVPNTMSPGSPVGHHGFSTSQSTSLPNFILACRI